MKKSELVRGCYKYLFATMFEGLLGLYVNKERESLTFSSNICSIQEQGFMVEYSTHLLNKRLWLKNPVCACNIIYKLTSICKIGSIQSRDDVMFI